MKGENINKIKTYVRNYMEEYEVNEMNEVIPPCCLGKIKYLCYSEDPYPLRPSLAHPVLCFGKLCILLVC